MMKTIRGTTRVWAVGVCGTALLATGCQSNNVSYGAISRNLTPELQGTTERPIDIDRNIAVTSNVNWRSASDDLGRLLYVNHPSRLSPYPLVSPSGIPH